MSHTHTAVMLDVAVYDTKPYDRRFLAAAPGTEGIHWHFHEFRLSTETASAAQGAKAVCVFVNDRVDRFCVEKLSKLGVKLIALRCAGFNNVDLAAAKSLDIAITRVPAYSPHAVAEHALALLLTLSRRTHRAYNRVRELNFSLNGLEGFNIHGKTIGIIGTGKIGKITAQLFRGFDTRMLAYDPMPATDWAKQAGVEYVDLTSLLRTSDVVSLHVPLLPETNRLLNGRTIAEMKRGVVIINTSRGKLIETAALIHALKLGHIGGVTLDVYEEEEGVFFEDLSGQVLKDDQLSRLLTFPNVLITSHQGFLTQEGLSEIARVTTENILQLETGGAFLPETTL